MYQTTIKFKIQIKFQNKMKKIRKYNKYLNHIIVNNMVLIITNRK